MGSIAPPLTESWLDFAKQFFQDIKTVFTLTAMERENSTGNTTETSQIQNQISSILENQSVSTKEVTTTKESSKVVAYYEPTRYVYDETLKNPEVILEKTSTSGAVNAYYEYGAGGRYAKNGTQIYAYDGRGSVSEVTSSQNVVAQYRYDPYGNLLNGSVGQDQAYTYNAQQYTPQTGLQYLRARYYDASTGNFTSKDTYLGSQKSLVTQNRYTYGNNNPVSYQDPSGHAGLFSKIVSAAKSVVSTVVKTVTSVAKSVTKAVVNTVQKVVAAVQTAVKTVTTAVQSAAKTVASTAKAVVSAAKTKVTAAATAVKSAVSTASQMVSQVKSTLSSAAGAVSSGVAYVADAAQSAYTTVTAAISPAISRYNSSKVAVPMTQLDYTSIEDCAVPLSAALSDGAKGNIGVEEMQQSVGAWWLGGNGNSWKPIGANLLDTNSMNNYFYQTSLNKIPMLKDSAIENSALSVWNYTKKDLIRKGFEMISSSVGVFKETFKNTSFIENFLDKGDKYLNKWLESISNGKISTDEVGALALGMDKDDKGYYHTRPKPWQRVGGYNDLYDKVFDVGTDMNNAKFEFSTGDRDYVIWAWKGDYINLGAGAELGIYSNKSSIFGQIDVTSPVSEHWLVDTSLAMPMTMSLKYGEEEVGSHSGNHWWITSFNPEYKDLEASQLTATYTVDFTGKEEMYEAFYNKYGNENSVDRDERWTFAPETLVGTFEF